MYHELILHNLVASSDLGSSGISGISYVRDPTYLTLPNVSGTDNTFVGLFAVFPTNGYVSFTVNGKYTVDWGDGSAVTNYNAGTTASHTFTFSSINSILTSQGYKQVIIKITPQSGATLTSINLNVKNASATGSSSYTTGWLDIAIYGSTLTALTLAGNAPVIYHRLLEQVNIYKSAITSFSYMFAYSTNLQSVPNCDISKGTSFTYMFYQCYDLKVTPSMSLNSPGSLAYMFAYCYSLSTINLTINSATIMDYMFYNCTSLITMPNLNSGSVTSFQYMFAGCVKLKTITGIDVGSATGNAQLNSMFANCPMLTNTSISNIGNNFVLSGCNLTHASLLSAINSLKTVGGKTLDIRDNWGAPQLTSTERAVATSRGWTLTG